MKKLWCLIALSLLLNLAIGLKVLKLEADAGKAFQAVVQAIQYVNFKVDAISQ